MPSPTPPDRLDDPVLYINRELSFTQFNHRIFLLACDGAIPLLERLQYLCICSSNLDEFFEIRVAGLQQQHAAGSDGLGPDLLTPLEQLEAISRKLQFQVRHHYRLLNQHILPALSAHQIGFVSPRQNWSETIESWARDVFESELLPVLSPLGLDPAHPFPLLMNKSLNFIVNLSGKDAFGRESGLAIVRAARSLPRIIPVPPMVATGKQFILLSTILEHYIGLLFPGLVTEGVYQFRVTRNSELYLDHEESADMRLALQGELSMRDYGHAVRLETVHDCPSWIVDFLLQKFNLGKRDLYLCDGPVNLSRLKQLSELVDRPALKFRRFISYTPRNLSRDADLFAQIRQSDVLLHYPYESSSPVVNLLRQAARDPDVLAIKQTLYRTGTESVYVDALLEAAANGKDVMAVIELRARFDEKANIDLATRLQREGVQVMYGVVGIKTHVKMALIVRREADEMKRYAHICTGNYHTRTSRSYTDLSLLTASRDVCLDVQAIFNQISSLGKAAQLHVALYSPFTMHSRILELIQRQIDRAQRGEQAIIKARMNSLCEAHLIQALYRASQAGVRIMLLVRGICSLRAGMPGVSDNISVYSVVGRFLEHARVYAFGPESEQVVYLSSADWMHTDMFRRVEIAVPVRDEVLSRRIVDEAIDHYLADNRFCWELLPSGRYRRRKKQGEAFAAQIKLLDSLNKRRSESALVR